MTRSTEQVAAMYELHKAGWTYDNIGERYGVCRERVRQLFARAGLPRVVRLRKPERDLIHAEGMKAEIAAAFRRVGNVQAVANALELDVRAVRHILDELQLHAYATKQGDLRQYDDAELIDCLRTAGAYVDGVLSIQGYAAFAADRTLDDGRPWPTHQALQLRFGSWAAAKRAVGLAVSPRRRPPGRWTANTCAQALAAVWAELRHPPTYGEFVAVHAGRPELPSPATVRIRLGPRWPVVIETVDRWRASGETAQSPSNDAAPPRRYSPTEVSAFVRAAAVKDAVLERAAGKCECCGEAAPFMRADGSPYLEVHHVVPLSQGGEDGTGNAVALCPNCHRKLHVCPDVAGDRARLEALLAAAGLCQGAAPRIAA